LDITRIIKRFRMRSRVLRVLVELSAISCKFLPTN
jgi:hypothetical protein